MQLNITKDKENEAVSFETASFFFVLSEFSLLNLIDLQGSVRRSEDHLADLIEDGVIDDMHLTQFHVTADNISYIVEVQ